MDDKKSLFYFFEQLEISREKIKTTAKRSGISEDTAILLAIIYQFPKIDLPVNDEMFEQLKSKGLITPSVPYCVTGKGAILAKSFCEVLKSV